MTSAIEEFVTLRTPRGLFGFVPGGEEIPASTQWSSVEVTRRVDAAAGAFRLTLAAKVPANTLAGAISSGRDVGGLRAAFPVRRGDTIVVQTDARGSPQASRRTLATGIVDKVEMTGDADQLTISVDGRDRAADMVDCSAEHDPGEWLDVRIDELAYELATPFGVETFVDEPGSSHRARPLDLGARFEKFSLQSGETSWNALERAARQRSILLHSDEFGRLVLTRAGMGGSLGTQLVEGDGLGGTPVKRWRLWSADADRFGLYIVRGQGRGSDAAWGADVALVEGRCEDAGVGRYRPLVVVPEGSVTFEDAEDRARWEAAFRAARASGLEVDLVGWRKSPGGDLWRVNDIVTFAIPTAGAVGEALVAEVRFRKGDGGTLTTLKLVRPDAYLPQPVVAVEDPLDPDPSSSDDGGPEEGF